MAEPGGEPREAEDQPVVSSPVATSLRRRVGALIRALRIGTGTEARPDLSQEMLADRSSLHRTYIGELERGEKCPTVETLARIAQALGVSLSKFFQRVEADMPQMALSWEQAAPSEQDGQDDQAGAEPPADR